jgi:type I restriction enzyme R subunit
MKTTTRTAKVAWSRTPKRRPRPRPGALITVDIDDHIDPATRGWVTVDESGNIVFPEPSEAKANELGARFEAWLLGREFRRDQERLLHWMESQIRVNADVLDEFTPDDLEFPPFSGKGGGAGKEATGKGT